ncbi:glycosyltransferase [Amycolatopsis sp. NPDC059657]|uniref:glycosyltransferase n=1 Tax=Amycolatopsis sp. NPDC059657 TaxID=3346899 RepID=UPI00366FBEEB
MIQAVGIVIPARDEAARIGECLRALGRALRDLPVGLETAVCVVADRCHDTTERLVRANSDGMVVTNRGPLSIGEVRDLGIQRVRRALSAHRPSTVLLLNTDADTTVSPGWIRRHLDRANAGTHATAGVAELSGSLGPLARLRYRAVLDGARLPDGHGNVYGANLGVRADAYLSVGGFRPLATGEDHDLWRRLGGAGYRLAYDDKALVTTSSRLDGRAPNGLAELLRSISGRDTQT